MRRPSTMRSVSTVLEKVMKNLSLDKALLEAHILNHWEVAVGESIAQHAQPGEIRFNKLYVDVDSPMWLQELTMLKPTLIQKLNDALGKKGHIGDLALRIGRPKPSALL